MDRLGKERQPLVPQISRSEFRMASGNWVLAASRTPPGTLSSPLTPVCVWACPRASVCVCVCQCVCCSQSFRVSASFSFCPVPLSRSPLRAECLPQGLWPPLQRPPPTRPHAESIPCQESCLRGGEVGRGGGCGHREKPTDRAGSAPPAFGDNT